MAKKSGRSEEYVLTEAQLNKLWGECKELKDKVIVGCTAYLGMRISECTHLKSSWFRESGELHIPSRQECTCWECTRRKGYWVPKTKSSIRVIPIPAFLRPVLHEFFRYQPDGLGISRMAAWARIQRLSKRAKLPHIFPHALRASSATLYASKGFTAMELCAFFGWSRISVAESYVRLATAREGAKQKMRQIFG